MNRAKKPGRQRRREDIAKARFLSTCGWCDKKMRRDAEGFTVGGKVSEGFDMEYPDGKVIPFTLVSRARTLTAFAPPSTSPVKQEGQDIVFMLCSQSCCGELTKAMEEDTGHEIEKRP